MVKVFTAAILTMSVCSVGQARDEVVAAPGNTSNISGTVPAQFPKTAEACIQELAQKRTVIEFDDWNDKNPAVVALHACNPILHANDALLQKTVETLKKTKVAGIAGDPMCVCYRPGPDGKLTTFRYIGHAECIALGRNLRPVCS